MNDMNDMRKNDMRPPPGGEADLQPGWEEGERPNRVTEDWLETIGPEDMDRDTVVEMLEEYGFDFQDDDEQLDLPKTADVGGYNVDEGDPDELGETIGLTLLDAEDNTSLRPVEDQAIDDLDDE